MPQLLSQQDALLIASLNFPAANSTAQSNYFDVIGADPTLGGGAVVPRKIEWLLSVPALPNNVTSADPVVVQLTDSADGVTFAAIDEIAPVTIPGVTTSGSAAVTKQYRLPPTTRRYVGFSLAPATGSGNNTAAAVTLQPVFP